MDGEYYTCPSCSSNAEIIRGKDFLPYFRCNEGDCRDMGKIDEQKVKLERIKPWNI